MNYSMSVTRSDKQSLISHDSHGLCRLRVATSISQSSDNHYDVWLHQNYVLPATDNKVKRLNTDSNGQINKAKKLRPLLS